MLASSFKNFSVICAVVSDLLRCEETRNWREEFVDKRFTSIEPEIGTRRIATIKENDKLQKVGLYLTFEGLMTTLVITNSNGQWPNVD
jgi:hypothetical protein